MNEMTDKERDAFTAISLLMHEAIEEAMNETFGTKGWFYRDIGWTKQSYFTEILETIGSENCKAIASSVRDDWEGGPFCRGQFLISPEGMKNIKDWGQTHV